MDRVVTGTTGEPFVCIELLLCIHFHIVSTALAYRMSYAFAYLTDRPRYSSKPGRIQNRRRVEGGEDIDKSIATALLFSSAAWTGAGAHCTHDTLTSDSVTPYMYGRHLGGVYERRLHSQRACNIH